MSRTPAHAHTQMQMLYALHVERINTGINQAGGLDPVAESTRQMPTLAHALMLSNAHKPAHAHTQTGDPTAESTRRMPTLAHALMLSHAHKPAHAHTQTGRGMEEQIIDVDELVHELPRVAEITELRHSVAVHQLVRRGRRHLRHTHRLCTLSVRRPHRRSATRSASPERIPAPTP